jgi:ribosomal protein RSM22 (predicted rRNA methylase)
LISFRFKNYTTKQCKTCPARELCTKSAANGKQVRRSEFTENIENNKRRVRENEKTYKRRQAIVEHPYGTIKRQWGFNYIITKKYFERAEADFGLIMTAYNLRRIFNIAGIAKLMKYLNSLHSDFKLKNAILEPKSSFFKLSIIKMKNYNYFAMAA